jgi:hypothetical protein
MYMRNGADGALAIAHVGFTGSDADRERSLTMEVWLARNDPGFAAKLRAAQVSGNITADNFDLNSHPPRDFLTADGRADAVVVHNLWGFPDAGRWTGGDASSPQHDLQTWNRRLALTGALYIFNFGGDFHAEPDGYTSIAEPSLYNLTVWTKFETPRRERITLTDLAEARLTRLKEMAANEVLDLSHVSAIASDQLAAIAGMPNLRILLLSGVPVQDAQIAAMLRSGCYKLRSLYLDHTPIGDAGLEALRSCSELSLLSLNDTAVGGSGLMHLRRLPELRTLSLVNTNVSAGDVEALSALRNLRILALTGSRMSHPAIEKLARALPQCAIDVAYENAL